MNEKHCENTIAEIENTTNWCLNKVRMELGTHRNYGYHKQMMA